MSILTNSKIKEGLFFYWKRLSQKNPKHIVEKRGSVKKSEFFLINL